MSRSDDDDRFRLSVGSPRARGESQTRLANRANKFGANKPRTNTCPSRVVANTRHAKGKLASSRRPGSRLGRGHLAARLSGQKLVARSRRAITKTRLVRLAAAGRHSTRLHLRYIQREGVSRDGSLTRLFSADTDNADAVAFEERTRSDRHQFRIIIAPEDGAKLGDLKTFTRELMEQVEQDLGTSLDWVAADHWDTDNPHIHIVIRGKDDTGCDLIIASDYIKDGLRHRTAELATEWLGLRTQREIEAAENREVDQERFNSLDRKLQRIAHEGLVDLSPQPMGAAQLRERALLSARLTRLATMGLARQCGEAQWTLSPDLERTLRIMGERGDIIRTMQRAFTRENQRDYVIFDAATSPPITGRIVAKGLADELDDRVYVIIDGIDGRAHYVTFGSNHDIADLPIGAIVTARSGIEQRAADRNIAAVAEDGIYRTTSHLEHARENKLATYDPEAFVEAHVRRLEALRRAGIVERVGEGVWRVPPDLIQRGQVYNASRTDGAQIDIRSHWPVERQTRAIGATWLDHQLLTGTGDLATKGFGAEVRQAITERENHLIAQGLAQRRNQRIMLASNLLDTLRARELAATATQIESETGLTHRLVADGDRITGIYRRSVTLASGRFALIQTDSEFSLLPWRPVIEQRLNQSITAVIRGGTISWQLTRHREIAL